MKALILKKPGTICIDNIPLKELGASDVMVKVVASNVCSTDFKRIFEGKSYFYPIVLGHEFSGVVGETGKEVKKIKVGDRVVIVPLILCKKCFFCKSGQYSLCDNYSYIGSRTNGGYSEYAIIPQDNVIIIPKNLSYEDAAFCEPIAVSIHGLLKVLRPGDKVLVMGAGVIGLLCAKVSQNLGSLSVLVADIKKERLNIARKLEIETVQLDPGRIALSDNLRSKNFDIVIEASGNIMGLKNSIDVLRKNGTLLNISLYNSTLDLDKEILNKITRGELNIKGSWNSYSQPFPGIEWQMAINLLNKKLIDPKPLISHRVNLSEADVLLNRIYQTKDSNLMKILILPGDPI